MSKSDPVNNRHSRANGNPAPPFRHTGECQYPVINIIILFSFYFASMASYFLLLTPQEVTKKEGASMSWPTAPLDRKLFLAVVDTQPPVADQLK